MYRWLKGAAAGAVATIPMTMAMEAMHRRLDGEPPAPLPPREITESLAEKAGAEPELSEEDLENLTLAAHVGYGALCGALFGAIAPRNRAAAFGAGLLFGTGVWVGSYLGWLPALNVRHHPKADPPARTGLMIAAHLVWGGTAGLIVGSGRREQDA
jgi:hypothetical protein